MELENREEAIRFRVLRDEAFREALLKDPAATLEREYGVSVPSGWTIQVHEETEGVVHLVVPGRVLPDGRKVPEDVLDDTIADMMREGRTGCCTCGGSTDQTFSSLQTGCGCA